MKEENGTVEKEERDKREVRYERDERGKGRNETIEKELERKKEGEKKKTKRNEQKERNEIRSKKNNSRRVWAIVSIA